MDLNRSNIGGSPIPSRGSIDNRTAPGSHRSSVSADIPVSTGSSRSVYGRLVGGVSLASIDNADHLFDTSVVSSEAPVGTPHRPSFGSPLQSPSGTPRISFGCSHRTSVGTPPRALTGSPLDPIDTSPRSRFGTPHRRGTNASGSQSSLLGQSFASMNSDNWRKNAGPNTSSAQVTPMKVQQGSAFTGGPGFHSHHGNKMSDDGLSVGNGPGPTEIAPRTSTVIYIAKEREGINENPHAPRFLDGYPNLYENNDAFVARTLRYVNSCVFVLESVADINFLSQVINSPNYKGMKWAVTNLSFPKLYWFSGVRHNRTKNPYFAFLETLPAVEVLSFTLHIAGFTVSAWGERERIKMEETNFEKSKQLKLLRLQDLCKYYDINRLFNCNVTKAINMELITSDMVSHYVTLGDPVSLYQDLCRYLVNGLREVNSHAVVQAHVRPRETQ